MAGLTTNKQSRLKKLQSALANKKLASEYANKLFAAQNTYNAILAKLNLDTPAALDTDFVATLAITSLFDPDAPASPSQNKNTYRQSMVAALHHRTLANEMCDSLEEMQVAMNALLAKLDAEAGVLAATDFASTLSVAVLNPGDDTMPAQNKSTARNIMRSALADAKLADELIDAVSDMQAGFNDALALLDAGTITGVMAALEVTPFDPAS